MILGGRDGRGRGRDTQYTCITECGGGCRNRWDENDETSVG